MLFHIQYFFGSCILPREKDYERGIRIANRRKEIGLSQDELAHRVGIGRQALSAIENGGDFKTQTLDNLAIVLGVSVDFIMYGKNEENSELLSEAMDVLSDMDELQIRQCLAMMKATVIEDSGVREEIDRALIRQFDLLPVARKMVMEELANGQQN